MNPDTGSIARFETEEDARRAGYTVPLTDDQANKLAGMSRSERRRQARLLMRRATKARAKAAAKRKPRA